MKQVFIVSRVFWAADHTPHPIIYRTFDSQEKSDKFAKERQEEEDVNKNHIKETIGDDGCRVKWEVTVWDIE